MSEIPIETENSIGLIAVAVSPALQSAPANIESARVSRYKQNAITKNRGDSAEIILPILNNPTEA